MGIRSNTQVKQWVKKHRSGEALEDNRGSTQGEAWRKGRPKTKFASVEEERDYLKAEVEYLKKQFQIYTGSDSKNDLAIFPQSNTGKKSPLKTH
jgi:transposase